MIPEREETRDRRATRVERVGELVDQRFGPDYEDNFVALGDFNDYLAGPDDELSALRPLVRQHEGLVDPGRRLPEDASWTHYYDEDAYRQFDYILLGQALDARADPRPAARRTAPTDLAAP